MMNQSSVLSTSLFLLLLLLLVSSVESFLPFQNNHAMAFQSLTSSTTLFVSITPSGNDDEYDAGDMDMTSINDMTFQSTSTEAVVNVGENDNKKDSVSSSSSSTKSDMEVMISETAIYIGMISILVVFLYGFGTWTLGFVTGLVSSISQEFVNELGHMTQGIVSFLGMIVSFMINAMKFLVPVVGKGVVQVSNTVSPYVQDAAHQVSESIESSGVVESLQESIDSTIVSPIQEAVDITIVTPLQGMSDSVSSAVTSSVNDNVVHPVQEAIESNIVSPLQEQLPKVDLPKLPTISLPFEAF